jgi:hypothetical protein
MMNPVSSAYAAHASFVSQPAMPKPQQPTQSKPPQDTVSLKSTGDVDHDGDSK